MRDGILGSVIGFQPNQGKASTEKVQHTCTPQRISLYVCDCLLHTCVYVMTKTNLSRILICSIFRVICSLTLGR